MPQVLCLWQQSSAVWKLRWPSWLPVHDKPTVSVDVKQHSTNQPPSQSSGAVWKLTWLFLLSVPTVSVDVKQHSTNQPVAIKFILTASSFSLPRLFLSLSLGVSSWSQPPKPASLFLFSPPATPPSCGMFQLILSFLLSPTLPCPLASFLKFSNWPR